MMIYRIRTLQLRGFIKKSISDFFLHLVELRENQ